MQALARRLLAALQAEGYGNNVQVASHSTNVGEVREELSQLSISSLQVREESENSIIVDLELDSEELDGSPWNKAQSLTSRSIMSQSASLTDGNATSIFRLQVRFSQVRPSSFLDQPFFDSPVGHHDEFPVPTITLNDVQVRRPLSDLGNSWSSNRSKGVTYPSDYDDIS
jgi:hypothetical protein